MAETRTVCFCDNNSTGNFASIAHKVVSNMFIDCNFYSGLTRDTRESSLDKEVRDNFYNADLRVVLICQTVSNNSEVNHWVIDELKNDFITNYPTFIYTIGNVDLQINERHADSFQKDIEDISDFENKLIDDLKRFF